MPLRLPAAAARLSRRHFARVFTVACAALLTGAAGCGGDDSTGSRNVDGTYALTQLQGVSVPFSQQTSQGRVDVGQGQLALQGGQYEVAIELALDGDDQSIGDAGTFERNGSQIQLRSSNGQGTTQGTFSNNNRVLDLVGSDGVRYRFERD